MLVAIPGGDDEGQGSWCLHLAQYFTAKAQIVACLGFPLFLLRLGCLEHNFRVLWETNSKSWSRAAGLEQELETSKQKVALLTRENQNLQEELSEAYRLKVILLTFYNCLSRESF